MSEAQRVLNFRKLAIERLCNNFRGSFIFYLFKQPSFFGFLFLTQIITDLTNDIINS